MLDNIIIYIKENQKYLGIISFNIVDYSSSDVVEILNNEFQICVRGGFHCSPFVHDFIGSNSFNGTVRISLGAFNTKDDIDKLIKGLKSL